MTIDEAKLFFKLEEEDDIQDAYDEQLFEFKQFFLSKPIISKVFKSKLEKLAKFEEAFCLLTDSRFKPLITEKYSIDFSYNVLEAFQRFEQLKSELKQQISLANSSSELTQKVESLLEVTYSYYKKWKTTEKLPIEIDVIAKDPDSMELLTAIRAFNLQGGVCFQDISSQKNQPVLMKEMKRVSLLLEKFGNE